MSIYRHKKRGSLYVMVGRAGMQIEEHPELEKRAFVVYRALADDTLWVRPESEFMDGRFVPVGHYYLERREFNRPKTYWKNGEGRGWKATVAEATLFSDNDFAARERTEAFTREERNKIYVRSLLEEES